MLAIARLLINADHSEEVDHHWNTFLKCGARHAVELWTIRHRHAFGYSKPIHEDFECSCITEYEHTPYTGNCDLCRCNNCVAKYHVHAVPKYDDLHIQFHLYRDSIYTIIQDIINSEQQDILRNSFRLFYTEQRLGSSNQRKCYKRSVFNIIELLRPEIHDLNARNTVLEEIAAYLRTKETVLQYYHKFHKASKYYYSFVFFGSFVNQIYNQIYNHVQEGLTFDEAFEQLLTDWKHEHQLEHQTEMEQEDELTILKLKKHRSDLLTSRFGYIPTCIICYETIETELYKCHTCTSSVYHRACMDTWTDEPRCGICRSEEMELV